VELGEGGKGKKHDRKSAILKYIMSAGRGHNDRY
jgi:hypothetical protein